jgi:putative aldouronate transport system permease protein
MLSKGEKIANGFIIFFLLILCFSMLYPFWNCVVIAFNEGLDTVLGGITFWPRKFTLENMRFVLQDPRILHAFGITVARTVAGTLLSIVVTSVMAFALSRPELKYRNRYMTLALISMYFSGGMIPTYILIRDLGLRDTFWVYIIPGALSVWNMIIFRSFFSGIPKELVEAAMIDGANWYDIFLRIIVPVSLPVFATLALFTAVGQWNSWFDATLYVSNPNLMPIQNILNTILNSSTMREMMSKLPGSAANAMKSSQVTSRSISLATMLVATVPVLAIYPFVQRFFVTGVMLGSLKE